MTSKEEYDFFVEQLLDNAVKEFKSTEHDFRTNGKAKHTGHGRTF